MKWSRSGIEAKRGVCVWGDGGCGQLKKKMKNCVGGSLSLSYTRVSLKEREEKERGKNENARRERFFGHL
jgi:hypothetical protein